MNKGILYINNFSKLDKSVGTKINIMRFKPSWVCNSDVIDIEELAPSVALLNKWMSRDISWREYESIYLDELLNSNMIGVTKLLKLLDEGQNVTIHCTCSVSVEKLCHRYIVAELIKKNGYTVFEIPNKTKYESLVRDYSDLDEQMKVIVYNMINNKNYITIPKEL